ncbi:hypothetical protein ACFL0O_09620, partial [Thermodesulfobacteriota bacterium]
MEAVKISEPGYDLKPYEGERLNPGDWVFQCYNKFGYDIGLQIREKTEKGVRSSQKIYYSTGKPNHQDLASR